MRKMFLALAVLAVSAMALVAGLTPAAQGSSSSEPNGLAAAPQTWCGSADKYGAGTYERPTKTSQHLEPLPPNAFVSGTLVIGDPIGGDNRWLYVSTEYRRFHVAFNDVKAWQC